MSRQIILFVEKWLSRHAMPFHLLHGKPHSQLQNVQLQIASQTDQIWLPLIDTNPDQFSSFEPALPRSPDVRTAQ